VSIGLANILESAGKPTREFGSPDGSKILVLPYGGRVLGLFASSSAENFYWTHPALASVESARGFYSSDQWHNSGGDRTWLAPEIDLFFPDYPSRKTYFQQRALDPGSYEVADHNGVLEIAGRFEVKNYRTGRLISLEISKRIGPALNPLRYERALDVSDVEYAGYTQRTLLKIADGGEHSRIGLWSLVQMPHGGDLLIPTYSMTKPTLIFGSVPDQDILVQDRMIRYRMRQTGEHKIAVKAVATTGRVGYKYRSGSRWALIVRNFAVNPSGEYIDTPWDDFDDLGYSAQACNVNSTLGQFSELEYHIPAIGAGTERLQCSDETQVWAFRGSKRGVEGIARVLLGANEDSAVD